MFPYSYALEKFEQAVETLATEPGDVRSRLYSAFLNILMVQSEDLPEELHADFEWIRTVLTKKEERYPGQGKLAATIFSMRNSTGVKVAKRFVEIRSRLRSLYEAHYFDPKKEIE